MQIIGVHLHIINGSNPVPTYSKNKYLPVSSCLRHKLHMKTKLQPCETTSRPKEIWKEEYMDSKYFWPKTAHSMEVFEACKNP
jgi:hypothetical protein